LQGFAALNQRKPRVLRLRRVTLGLTPLALQAELGCDMIELV
jgi:hypothetical protein